LPAWIPRPNHKAPIPLGILDARLERLRFSDFSPGRLAQTLKLQQSSVYFAALQALFQFAGRPNTPPGQTNLDSFAKHSGSAFHRLDDSF
jgi:hypothetical protein